MTRIFNLNAATEKQLLRARQFRDRQAERVAAKIIADVRKRGDAGLFAYTKKLDHLTLNARNVYLPCTGAALLRPNLPGRKHSTTTSVSSEFLRAIRHAAKNVRAVSEKQLPRPWTLTVEPGVTIRQSVSAIDAIGCYIPGGRHALVSTLIMTVVPAQVAGVKNIVVVCPRPSDELLAAADFLGVKQIAQIGGAQSVTALAYGTQSIPRVEKIFGPGNRYVTAAKQLVSSDCAIDLPAGPTEAIVLTNDPRANAKWIASDLLAQGEHAPDAGSFFVTTSKPLAKKVQTEVEAQLAQLPPTNPAHISMRKAGAILVASSLAQACDFVNRFAPEHLSLPGNDASLLLKKCNAAGTVFVGPYAAQPLGDYASGSNHVLPTAGWARRRGGLSAADFVKCVTVQEINGTGFARLADDVQSLANAEGLQAHANAIEVRR
ncbi:MAG TPA: histidinol dehydrogenase [Candidatus Acidoferrum sp.]|jgi:histidinol dehydrogenase